MATAGNHRKPSRRCAKLAAAAVGAIDTGRVHVACHARTPLVIKRVSVPDLGSSRNSFVPVSLLAQASNVLV